MGYIKYLSLILCIFMLCAVMPLNAASNDDLDPDDEIGEAVDIHTFSYLSQVVYEDMFLLDYPVNAENAIPKELHSLNDVASFYNAHHIPSTVVQTNKENLKMGDIVQLDDEDCPFLIYLGVRNGNTYLRNIKGDYYVKNDEFYLIFKGNALIVNHTVKSPSKMVNFMSKNTAIKKKGVLKRAVNSFWKTGVEGAVNTWYNNDRIRNIATGTLSWKKGIYRDRAQRIWNWMRGGGGYARHMYFHCTVNDPLAEWWMGKKMAHWGTIHTVDQTLNAKHGNCVEQARLIVGLARAMGCKARYVLQTGHVWAQISETGGDGPTAWIDMETTRCSNMGDYLDRNSLNMRGYQDDYNG